MRQFIQLYKSSYSGVPNDVWLLSLIMFINRAGAMVLPFLSLYLSTIEGYSLERTGTILLFYGIGSLGGNYFGGVLSDKIGAFRVMVFSLMMSGIMFWVLIELHTPLSFSIGLLLCSFCLDLFRPANMSSIAILTQPEHRTKAVGINRLAINLGFAAGPASGGAIAFWIGYDWLFRVDAITCFIASILMVLFFWKYLNAEGKTTKENNDVKPSMLLVLKDKSFLLMLSAIFLLSLAFMQFFHALPVFLRGNMALTENYIGGLMALNGLLVVLIELPLIELLKKRKSGKIITLGSILIACCYGVLIFEDWRIVAVLCVILFTLGEVLTLPFITSLIMNRAPDNLRGRYLALYGMTFSLTNIIAPSAGLAIAAWFGFSCLWMLVFTIGCLAGFGVFLTSTNKDK